MDSPSKSREILDGQDELKSLIQGKTPPANGGFWTKAGPILLAILTPLALAQGAAVWRLNIRLAVHEGKLAHSWAWASHEKVQDQLTEIDKFHDRGPRYTREDGAARDALIAGMAAAMRVGDPALRDRLLAGIERDIEALRTKAP